MEKRNASASIALCHDFYFLAFDLMFSSFYNQPPILNYEILVPEKILHIPKHCTKGLMRDLIDESPVDNWLMSV